MEFNFSLFSATDIRPQFRVYVLEIKCCSKSFPTSELEFVKNHYHLFDYSELVFVLAIILEKL